MGWCHSWRSPNPLLHMVLAAENPVGKKPLGRPRLRWEDVVKIDVKSLGGGPDWNLECRSSRQGDLEDWLFDGMPLLPKKKKKIQKYIPQKMRFFIFLKPWTFRQCYDIILVYGIKVSYDATVVFFRTGTSIYIDEKLNVSQMATLYYDIKTVSFIWGRTFFFSMSSLKIKFESPPKDYPKRTHVLSDCVFQTVIRLYTRHRAVVYFV